MKIVNRQPQETADVSSARGTAGRELWQLVLLATLLLIALYFVLGWLVDFTVAKISFETEAKLFKFYRLPLAEEEDAADHPDFGQAQSILARLTDSPRVAPLPYRLVILDEKTPNAFAFPGGTIGVTSGLLDLLDEEIEIAFVLGHELGHFAHRDHLQGMGRALGFRMVMMIVFGSGPGANSLGDMVEFVFQRDYSQESERQADCFGLELVHGAYGHVDGVDRLFRILLEKGALPGWAYMFATHPSPKERIAYLKSYAQKLE